MMSAPIYPLVSSSPPPLLDSPTGDEDDEFADFVGPGIIDSTPTSSENSPVRVPQRNPSLHADLENAAEPDRSNQFADNAPVHSKETLERNDAVSCQESDKYNNTDDIADKDDTDFDVDDVLACSVRSEGDGAVSDEVDEVVTKEGKQGTWSLPNSEESTEHLKHDEFPTNVSTSSEEVIFEIENIERSRDLVGGNSDEACATDPGLEWANCGMYNSSVDDLSKNISSGDTTLVSSSRGDCIESAVETFGEFEGSNSSNNDEHKTVVETKVDCDDTCGINLVHADKALSSENDVGCVDASEYHKDSEFGNFTDSFDCERPPSLGSASDESNSDRETARNESPLDLNFSLGVDSDSVGKWDDAGDFQNFAAFDSSDKPSSDSPVWVRRTSDAEWPSADGCWPNSGDNNLGDGNYGNDFESDDDDDDFGDFAGPTFKCSDNVTNKPCAAAVDGEFGESFGDFSKPGDDPVVTDYSNIVKNFSATLNTLFELHLLDQEYAEAQDDSQEAAVMEDESSGSVAVTEEESSTSSSVAVAEEIDNYPVQQWSADRVCTSGLLKDLSRVEYSAMLSFKWDKSAESETFIRSLSIDPRSLFCCSKNANMPKFAAMLTPSPLEPQKSDQPSEGGRLCSSGPLDDFSLSRAQLPNGLVPNAHFDWSSSGLTNPLDDLERELLSSSSSSPKPKPTESNLYSTIMSSANQQTTELILSSESRTVLRKLPKLNFIRSRVLMFPLSKATGSQV